MEVQQLVSCCIHGLTKVATDTAETDGSCVRGSGRLEEEEEELTDYIVYK